MLVFIKNLTLLLTTYTNWLFISGSAGAGVGGAGDAGYGAAEPAYGGPAPSYDSYAQPAYTSYQQPQSQYSNNYGKYQKY